MSLDFLALQGRELSAIQDENTETEEERIGAIRRRFRDATFLRMRDRSIVARNRKLYRVSRFQLLRRG